MLQKERAKWNSLDSVVVFGWSGSAVLGGVLVDKCGFDITFCITAAMQGVGVLVLILLLPLVPRVEGGSPSVSSLSSLDTQGNGLDHTASGSQVDALDHTVDAAALAAVDTAPAVMQPDAVAGGTAPLVDMRLTSHLNKPAGHQEHY